MSHPGKVRILYVAHDTGLIGGAERQLMELFRGLDRSEFVPHLVCLEEGGPVAERSRAMGVTIHSMVRNWRWDLGVSLRLASLIRSGGFSIVHAYLGLPGFYASIAGRLACTRVITTIRTSAPPKRWAGAVERFGFLLSDRVIANSRAGVQKYFRHFPGKSKSRVIYNGYDPEDFRPAAVKDRRELGLPESGTLIGHVANLTFIKDYPTFLRSLALVLKQHPEGYGIIVGEGAMRAEYEALAAALGIAERTLFMGHRTDVLDLVRHFDVCVLASHPLYSEGLSNSVAEYMGLEKPVVATAVGGNGELVHDGETGFLVPPGDPRAMAGRISELVSDPELRESMGRRGREFFQNRLTLERMVQETQEVYRELTA
jgi:glycosyltransferase involved in cell wall biosynthesis